MSQIWFTSDTHYGHTNIASKSCSKWDKGYRGFNSLDHMNQVIVRNINKLVAHDDVLYHLGDWSFGGEDNIKKFRDQINCKSIHLILGNHDTYIDNDRFRYSNLFNSIQNVLTLKCGKRTLFLSHYAHRVWHGSHKGVNHLYGHSHSSIDDNYGKSMDIGVDNVFKLTGEYKPLSLFEVALIMDKKEVNFIDGHNKDTNI